MTPYRLIVSARGYRRGRVYKGRGPLHKGAYTRIEPCAYAYLAWTPNQVAEPWRLTGGGTFLFAGLHVVRSEALRLLALSATEQVSIRTNQDHTVYRFVKRADGSIIGYGGNLD